MSQRDSGNSQSKRKYLKHLFMFIRYFDNRLELALNCVVHPNDVYTYKQVLTLLS